MHRKFQSYLLKHSGDIDVFIDQKFTGDLKRHAQSFHKGKFLFYKNLDISTTFKRITLKLSIRIKQELVPAKREHRHSTINIKVAANGQTRPNFSTKIALTPRRFCISVCNFGRILPTSMPIFAHSLVRIG